MGGMVEEDNPNIVRMVVGWTCTVPYQLAFDRNEMQMHGRSLLGRRTTQNFFVEDHLL